jgi:GTP-binding protein
LTERLQRELEHNVGLRLEDTEQKDFWRIMGRGTLHLSVLIENMRREGYELSVGQPKAIIKDGMEPWDEVTLTVPNEYAGIVIDKLSRRSGILQRHEMDLNGIATLELEVPSRGLIGYRNEFLTDTRGDGIMYHTFSRFAPRAPLYRRRENGVLVVKDTCVTVTYGLHGLQERGRLIVGPGEKVYTGQIVGIHNRSNDIIVNPGRKKHLTNIRAAGTDEALHLTPPLRLSLEEAILMIEEDELVEVTPKAIRMRKWTLDPQQLRREAKARSTTD